ncbi:MAG: transposase [Planctomycetota bacterium]|jgi:putative transposase
MPRLARAVAVGFAHHITQRGNNRQDVFFVDDDHRVYLKLLKEQADKYALELIGYCLMSNHVHIIAIPRAEDSLAKAVGRTHFRYTQYINRFHRRSGHLWQGRFYSCALDERHFWLAMRYIELNPIRARLCRKPWRYEWSSAATHVDPKARSDVMNLSCWYDMISAAQWRKQLAAGVSDSDLGRLRSSTHTGRPLGSDSFLSKLERLLGRRIRPMPVGRPRQNKKAKKRKKTAI